MATVSSDVNVYKDLFSDVFTSEAHQEPNDNQLSCDSNSSSSKKADTHVDSCQTQDLARLKRIHTTEGYRQGISVSKALFIQAGFDEGYALGAVLGSTAGRLLGVLSGLLDALLHSSPSSGSASGASSGSGTGTGTGTGLPAAAKRQVAALSLDQDQGSGRDDRTTAGPGARSGSGSSSGSETAANKPRSLLVTARHELDVKTLFGETYFGADGVWVYPVTGEDEDGYEVTFTHVAACHPLIRKWDLAVRDLMRELNVDDAVHQATNTG